MGNMIYNFTVFISRNVIKLFAFSSSLINVDYKVLCYELLRFKFSEYLLKYYCGNK